jgi:hypothetical protein
MHGFPSAKLPGWLASVLNLKGCDPISYRLMDTTNSNNSYFLFCTFVFAIYKEMQFIKILFYYDTSPLIVKIIVLYLSICCWKLRFWTFVLYFCWICSVLCNSFSNYNFSAKFLFALTFFLSNIYLSSGDNYPPYNTNCLFTSNDFSLGVVFHNWHSAHQKKCSFRWLWAVHHVLHLEDWHFWSKENQY